MKEIFREVASSRENFISLVSLRIARWAITRKELSNIEFHEINKEACKICGQIEERRTVPWSPPPIGS